jgi:hypothetical protein
MNSFTIWLCGFLPGFALGTVIGVAGIMIWALMG